MRHLLFTILITLALISTASANPVITEIYHTPYSTNAYIHWTTDTSSDHTVEYSLHSDLSSSLTSVQDNATTSPHILLEGLARDTTYYYQVTSTDGAGATTSLTRTFSTENNTHGFSQYFDQAFTVNEIDGWGVGQSMFGAYADTVGAFIFWTLLLGTVFLVIAVRTESVIIPVVLALVSAVFLFPLLPPEHDIAVKALLGLAITGLIFHLYIGRR